MAVLEEEGRVEQQYNFLGQVSLLVSLVVIRDFVSMNNVFQCCYLTIFYLFPPPLSRVSGLWSRLLDLRHRLFVVF